MTIMYNILLGDNDPPRDSGVDFPLDDYFMALAVLASARYLIEGKDLPENFVSTQSYAHASI